MEWIYALDLFGTLVFAISGVLTAIVNKFDLVGSFVIGLVTAVGGGTLRDILLGDTPVNWMENQEYLAVIVLGFLISYLFKEHIMKLRKGMFLFDTLGIGVFTILGLQKTLALGLSPLIALMMGVVAAVFGGVIRDVLTNIVPLIFRAEIYATACLIGGIVFLLIEAAGLPAKYASVISMLTVIVIRYLAVKNKWSLHFHHDRD
ncbi:MAG TPA: trimeric intracellular cation channel family protein [Saprospiraceae bacterium]|nr:trimeric intracellular cation channel family protein [Saprospiraceae bacterium]